MPGQYIKATSHLTRSDLDPVPGEVGEGQVVPVGDVGPVQDVAVTLTPGVILVPQGVERQQLHRNGPVHPEFLGTQSNYIHVSFYQSSNNQYKRFHRQETASRTELGFYMDKEIKDP